MTTRVRSVICSLMLFGSVGVEGQDGDLLTSSGIGRGFFEAVPLVPGGAVVAPFNLNVGTSAFSLATLNVRGDQLQVDDAFSPPWPDPNSYRCTFRTDVPGGTNQNWSMVRGALEIGRLWHTNPANAFNVQARQATGNLWLRNSHTEGLGSSHREALHDRKVKNG